MKIVTAREFNQDIGKAKRSAATEPVFVTDRGRPTHVLLSIAAYQKLSGECESILDMIGAPSASPALDLAGAPFGLEGKARS